jgi:chaperonin GroEL (HSP60 family)
MIELARAQDEEVGDGTTSVIILAGEILSAVEGFIEREIHPTVLVNAYFKALEEIVAITESVGVSTYYESTDPLSYLSILKPSKKLTLITGAY